MAKSWSGATGFRPARPSKGTGLGGSLPRSEAERRPAGDGEVRPEDPALRFFFESSSLMMGSVELLPDGDILHLCDNPATHRFFGVLPEGFAGRTSRSMDVPEEVIGFWRSRYLESGMKGGGVAFEFPHTGRTGEARLLAVTVAPLGFSAAGRPSFSYVAEDVTDRRAAEKALAETAALFDATFGQAAVGFAHVGLDGVWIRLNERLCSMLGYTREELRGRTFQELTHPDDLGFDREDMRRLMAGEIPSYVLEKRYLRKDGEALWVQLTVALKRDLSGAPEHFVSVVEDISLRKAAEAVLARDKAELEALMEQRSRELRETQGRLAQAEKLTALGELAGGVAHDFNNVMQAVLGGASLIRRRPERTPDVAHLAEMIEDAAVRGASVTRRLLAFARRGELRARPVEVTALFEALEDVLSHTLGAGIEVRIAVAAGLPPVLADPGQLETALVNLATNARDAMPDGGILSLSAEPDAVAPPGHPEGLQPGPYVRLCVADTGHGMDAATRQRVFEPFFTTKPTGEGTGLGLPMARGFAQQSGGALALDSAPGRGTRALMWLPVAATEAAAAEPEAPAGERRAESAAAATARLLLVDDEDLVRAVLAASLVEEGYRVVEARDADEALRALAQDEAIDLLITDLSMPGLDGAALIAALRPARPNLPVILLTGNAEHRRADAEGDAVRLLHKPATSRALAEAVEAMLAG